MSQNQHWGLRPLNFFWDFGKAALVSGPLFLRFQKDTEAACPMDGKRHPSATYLLCHFGQPV